MAINKDVLNIYEPTAAQLKETLETKATIRRLGKAFFEIRPMMEAKRSGHMFESCGDGTFQIKFDGRGIA